MKGDPLEHIDDISHHDPDDASAARKQSLRALQDYKNPKAIVQRQLQPQSIDKGYSNAELSEELLDPTLGYESRAAVVLPVEMNIDNITDESKSVEAAPAYSIKQSRLHLYASFPPPPIMMPNNSLNRKYNSNELNLAKHRLKRHSGFYGAVGVSSATNQEQGYADTTASFNYRFPKLLALPTSSHVPLIANTHFNLHLGANTNQSLGGTLSTLDGTISICLDISNPFPVPASDLHVRHGILPPRLDRRSYTLSASHNINWANTPCRVQGLVMTAPLPRPNWIVYGKKYRPEALNASHLDQFSLVLCNLDSYQDVPPNQSTKTKSKPKISISLGYGKGSNTWFGFPQSAIFVPDIDVTRDEIKIPPGYPAAYSTSIQLDLKQQLSASQTCQSVIEYRHLGQALSLGTTITRTFSSSHFSRVGVGIRHAFRNIWTRELWKQGRTWWLFQLQRGDATLCIPVAICPAALTTWESCIRLFYASVASLVVDAIVAEVLCGVTSMLRVKFLQYILGKECIDGKSILKSIRDEEMRQQQEEKQLLAQHISSARENALKQRDVMEKQAKSIAKKESEQGGLIIMKAIYGVIDNATHQWIRRHDGTFKLCALDATIPLQFWVNDGRLRIPAVSKKNMLGFYDVLEYVSDEDWMTEMSFDTDEEQLSIWQRACLVLKQQLGVTSKITGSRRDLRTVISIRYKWEDKTYDVMFLDDEAVQLPSSRSKEVVTP